MQKFYDETNTSLAEAKNERLSMKTNLKLAKLWLDRQEYGLLGKASSLKANLDTLADNLDTPQILKALHASIKPEDPDSDTVDNSRGTLLLEILAIEIKMYTETKNNKKLREIYDQTLQVKSAIPHPRIMGTIRECGGKMHMSERMLT
jgi:COP9 signalosome complex subunit 2